MGDRKKYRSHKKVQHTSDTHSTKHHRHAGKSTTPAPKFDFTKVKASDPNAVLDAPHADPDPRDDPKYIDNLSDFEVRQMLLWADRYMVYYDGGEVTFWNADIDFTKQEKLLEVTDVAASQAEALVNSFRWDDVALAGGYSRPYSFYKIAGGVIVPTVVSPATAPRLFDTIMAVNRDTAETAGQVSDFFRGQRNGLIAGMVLGGALRIGFPGTFGGGGGGGGGGAKLPDVPLPDPPTSGAAPVADTPVANDPVPAADPARTPDPAAGAVTGSDPVNASLLEQPSGPGVEYGKDAAARLAAQGKTGPGILKPLTAELNDANLAPADKAVAMQVACNAQKGFGAGPIAKMPNGDLVVTSRAPLLKGPVIIVHPDGVVVRGTADIRLTDDHLFFTVSNVKVVSQ